jgi:hypothetical protein
MRFALLVLTVLALGPVCLSAQEGASLNEVESLMSRGRIMEARETLESWWTRRFAVAPRSERQRGIWLRGKLTVDPSMAEMDFRRLVVEYPGGPFSDDALFRLGLSAAARGDLRAAQGSFEALVSGYPSSPRVSEARGWIREHAREIQALPTVPETPPPASRPRATPTDEAGDFSVQLGAFRSLERALVLASELRDAGYRPRVVRTPGNDLARVRTGRFPTRAGAEALAGELRGKGFDVTLASDAGAEERIRESLGAGQSL